MTTPYPADIRYRLWQRAVCRVMIFTFLLSSLLPVSASVSDSLLRQASQYPAGQELDSLSAWYRRHIDRNTYDALALALAGYNLSRDKGDEKHLPQFANLAGQTYVKLNRYDSAVWYLRQSIELWKKRGDSANVASSLNNLGVVFTDLGQYDTALVYHLQSLRFAEDTDNAILLAGNLNNIGLLHYYLGNYERSLQYYFRSARVRTEKMASKGMALLYNNIGINYYYLQKPDSVIYYFRKSLDIYRQTGDLRGQAMPLTNIGEIYLEQNKYEEALDYFNQALAIEEKLGDQRGRANSLQMIGNVYFARGDYHIALKYQLQSLKYLEAIPSPPDIRDVCLVLADTYEKMGDNRKALSFFRRYDSLKDSLFTLEKANQLAELETKYQTAQKEKRIALQQLELQHQQAEIRQQSILLILALVILLLLTGLVVLVWKAYRHKRRTSILLAEKNRSITESISYARKIQTAVLPPEELLRCILPRHFIYFRPLDIVSGDFYWITRKGPYLYLAVADCTGHGVPGAFMSMLGFSLLNELVGQATDTNAAEMLDQLRIKLKAALRQTGKENEAQDGMDVALCKVDFNGLHLDYAGANNPLIIIRQGQLFEYKADRMPIGIQAKEKPFSNHRVEIEKGDMVYLFSDGYIDQFGGEKNMRYRMENFRSLLLRLSTCDMKEQKIMLEENLRQWMGPQPQLDDILVLGFEVGSGE